MSSKIIIVIMPRILLLLFTIFTTNSAVANGLRYTPYNDAATDTIYNLLFCDDLALYKASHKGPVTGPWQVLLTTPTDLHKLQTLANSPSQETRLRILAFNELKKQNHLVKKKLLLGVIIEVGLEHGLDTLAAYQDLRARYINQSGKMTLWEARNPKVDAKIRKLFQESQPVIEKIGPWGKSRLSPPPAGMVRLTFLVSDGLYFGEGTMRDLGHSPLAGPVVTAATELLFELTRH